MDVLFLSGVSDRFWRRFVEGRLSQRASNPIVERWRRARSLGLPPEGPRESDVVTASELRERRDESAELLAAAAPVFEENARLFAEHDFVLLLADARGVVLKRSAGGDFATEADSARLIEGARWSETVRGTNAIGTALFEERPVGVEGAAHYARPNHVLACYASPVRAPDGRVVGVVDATSRDVAATRVVTLAVCGVARSIEARLRERAMQPDLTSLRPLLNRLDEPAILVSPQGDVACENDWARRWPRRCEFLRRLERVRREPGADRLDEVARSFEVRVEPLSSSGALLLPQVPRPSGGTPGARSRPGLSEDPFRAITGHDPAVEDAKRKASRFARTNLPILLLAETGTGKELMARAIHGASARSAGPFVALNCGALSEQLLESELFGYGDGAFTGARPGGKAGKLEAAHGGTLFLDEVAEMPGPAQAALLRVLENGSFHRVGEIEPRRVDLRLVCATSRDLPAMVAEGRFRSDLYFRVRGACLGLPPLRDRVDLDALVDALLTELAVELGRPVPRLSGEARSSLAGHRWPGNIRELKTALAHALALADGEIRSEHLPADPSVGAGGPTSREGAERRALLAALAASGGNLSEAARHLGIARSTLYRMMARHGVPRV